MRQLEFDFKDLIYVPVGSPKGRLMDYFSKYAEKHHFYYAAFLSYVVLLHHMLVDAKIPFEKQRIDKSIQKLVSGKRVLEIGCREGAFLKFLQDHGAEVLGSGRRAGANSMVPIVAVNMEEVEKSAPLRDFKPDMVISMGLLDRQRFVKKRWGAPDNHASVPYRQLLRGIRHIATPHTIFYVVPSVDTYPVISHDSLRQRKGIIKPKSISEGKYITMKFHSIETHRFGVRPRRKRNK